MAPDLQLTPDLPLAYAALPTLAQAGRVWLFLDYDGTLAEFAPTPDDILPDPPLIGLLRQLTEHPPLRVAVISGRRLSHIRALLPVDGLILAGTYGIELLLPGGAPQLQVALDHLRPVLDQVKSAWSGLVAGQAGFYVEDKGSAIALHARHAAGDVAEAALQQARRLVEGRAGLEPFRLLGGERFLEIGPRQADKGAALAALLERYPWPDALPVYIGDDDKDEAAFEVVRSLGGIAIVTAPSARPTHAAYRLESTAQVRAWLAELLRRLG